MALSTPRAQRRNGVHADWGIYPYNSANYDTAPLAPPSWLGRVLSPGSESLPNAASSLLDSGVLSPLEVGDRAFTIDPTDGNKFIQWVCLAPGSPGALDAVWDRADVSGSRSTIRDAHVITVAQVDGSVDFRLAPGGAANELLNVSPSLVGVTADFITDVDGQGLADALAVAAAIEANDAPCDIRVRPCLLDLDLGSVNTLVVPRDCRLIGAGSGLCRITGRSSGRMTIVESFGSVSGFSLTSPVGSNPTFNNLTDTGMVLLDLQIAVDRRAPASVSDLVVSIENFPGRLQTCAVSVVGDATRAALSGISLTTNAAGSETFVVRTTRTLGVDLTSISGVRTNLIQSIDSSEVRLDKGSASGVRRVGVEVYKTPSFQPMRDLSFEHVSLSFEAGYFDPSSAVITHSDDPLVP